MKNKQKRVESILNQLYEMHQQLFGHKYAIGIQLNQQSQFNKIIQAFRQLIFTIRHTQQQRTKRQNKKNYHQSPEGIRINYQIRQDIQRAQGILTEALKKLSVDSKKSKKKSKQKQNKNNQSQKDFEETIKKRQKIIQNCYELLKDVKQSEQGGTYHPPVTYQTLNDIKKQLIGKQYQTIREDSINIEEQEFFDQANKRDLQMDKQLDEIIQGNDKVKNKMTTANTKQDEIHQKVIKATKKTQALIQRINKDNKDLLQILKTYRRPNQLCLDITMIFMVLALIGVIINLVRTL